MKTGRLFWGVFFVGLGVFVLGEKFSLFCVQWSIAWKLWPVVLLIWGGALLIGGKLVRWIAAGAAALALAYLLAALFSFSWLDDEWRSGPVAEVREMVEPFDSSLRRASFVLESGAGIFSIGDTSTDLLAVSAQSAIGSYALRSSEEGEGRRYVLSLEGKTHWRLRNMRNRVDVRLHPAPVWDMELDVGAAKLQCDLSPLQIARVQVNAGASSMRLRLGDRYPETEVRINAGVSSIRLSIPESSGCEIHVDTKLTSKNFRGFTRYAERTYRTENFEAAATTILIDVDAGVSSITVDRY